jgi:hypothetical protein
MLTFGIGEATTVLAGFHVYLAAVIKSVTKKSGSYQTKDKKVILIQPTAPVLSDEQKLERRRQIERLKVYTGKGKVEKPIHYSEPWSI